MKTILLVEDEALLAENLQRYLTREGYRCLWCDTLTAAEQQWLAGDLVLLDRTMPEGGCPRLAAPVAGTQGAAGDRAHRKGGGE
ncbi:response regulator transcription factor [Aeromonas veronii]|uniref:response regulator transcription factor n=1 Tax=Aeromonas veronii TaxID=654 RepID=UPI00406BDBAB